MKLINKPALAGYFLSSVKFRSNNDLLAHGNVMLEMMNKQVTA